jgi:transglutaminase-like putative cysteine protease
MLIASLAAVGLLLVACNRDKPPVRPPEHSETSAASELAETSAAGETFGGSDTRPSSPSDTSPSSDTSDSSDSSNSSDTSDTSDTSDVSDTYNTSASGDAPTAPSTDSAHGSSPISGTTTSPAASSGNTATTSRTDRTDRTTVSAQTTAATINTPATTTQTVRTTPPTINLPTAPGVDTDVSDHAVIDYSNRALGYFTVIYSGSQPRIIVRVTGPGGVNTYEFNSSQRNRVLAFPLSRGNGSYTIEVFHGPADPNLSLARPNNLRLDVRLTNAHSPFLTASHVVNYNSSSAVVRTASELAAGRTQIETIEAVYNWFIANITYCNTRAAAAAANGLAGYVPDLNALMRDRRGICIDFASGMTAMLRSRNIPTRMEYGMAGDEYHAWISAWTRETGWVNGWIRFNGSSWRLMDPTFAAVWGDDNQRFRDFVNGNRHNTTEIH